MNGRFEDGLDDGFETGDAKQALGGMSASARASLVNRTHRVVRQRAKAIASQKNKLRSLWVPLSVCSAMLIILATGVWSLLDQYEVTPDGVIDSSDQFLVLLLWFLPVSMVLLAMVWFRRTRRGTGGGNEATQ